MRTQYVIYKRDQRGTLTPALSAGAFRTALKTSTFYDEQAATRMFEIVRGSHAMTVLAEEKIGADGVCFRKILKEHHGKENGVLGFLRRIRAT